MGTRWRRSSPTHRRLELSPGEVHLASYRGRPMGWTCMPKIAFVWFVGRPPLSSELPCCRFVTGSSPPFVWPRNLELAFFYEHTIPAWSFRSLTSLVLFISGRTSTNILSLLALHHPLPAPNSLFTALDQHFLSARLRILAPFDNRECAAHNHR